MIGLPHEEESDLAGIIDLISGTAGSPSPRPGHHQPFDICSQTSRTFQWEKQLSLEETYRGRILSASR